ncbi:MAG TPA: UDP-N-acetylmuramate dehydrogenase [Candidatus Saccharimonadales bacterium]|nr:UDP-N-acetylmuramate dehydrogenase [Candidatus Saccharimonadales bacterium]
MNISKNVSLKNYSTMKLGGNASYVVEIENKDDLVQAFDFAKTNNLKTIAVGTGSNLVWRDEGFDGLILVCKTKRYDVFREDDTNFYITVGSGEIWDDIVARTTSINLSGIEQLSLIPGTAGAAPVQNVGAYGQELSNVLVSVEVFDQKIGELVNIRSSECGFGYRTSRFKTTDKGRFFITNIVLHLNKSNPQPPYYSALKQYFEEHKISDITPTVVRDAVISIRKSKLPDVSKVANCGSFFTNPIIDGSKLEILRSSFPAVPYWENGDNKYKISAAWLIEQLNFKDYHDKETGMATWPTQPLVFVNEHAQSTSDLLKFAQKVSGAVAARFDIQLAQEPELLP